VTEAQDQDDDKRRVVERSLRISWRTSPVAVVVAAVAVVVVVVAAVVDDIVHYSADPD